MEDVRPAGDEPRTDLGRCSAAIHESGYAVLAYDLARWRTLTAPDSRSSTRREAKSMAAGQDKPTKISFVYSNPADPAAFEAAYPQQLALARKLPGLTRLQTSKVWPKEDGTPTPAYRLLDLYFADYAAASAAAAEAGALVGATLEHATGGVLIAFAEVLEDA
jgi:uncharacterized protein (TIGR02118 family)